jgi:CBS domain-containing protein
MRSSHHYETGAVCVRPDQSVRKVADEMSYYAVGCVVVTDAERRPLGILTDRDLLTRVVCTRRDPEKTLAEEVMTPDPVTGATDQPLQAILAAMESAGVRRLPIVRDGSVVGLVALDDIIAEIGRELGDLRSALRSEVLGARRAAQRRRVREDIAATFEQLRSQMANIGSESTDWIQRELESLRKRMSGS